MKSVGRTILRFVLVKSAAMMMTATVCLVLYLFIVSRRMLKTECWSRLQRQVDRTTEDHRMLKVQ